MSTDRAAIARVEQALRESEQRYERLRQSEQRYALAMEAAADGHMDWDLVTGEFFISPRMLQIVGHPPDATFADRADWVRRFPFHPEDRKRWETAIAAHFAGREAIFKMDLRIVVNGETRWLAFNFIATRDAAGKVVRWTGSIADLTDAKRDVATVVESIPGLVAILTPAGEVDAVNDQLADYCGQPLEAMRQWGTNGTVHPADLPRVVEVFMPAISMGQPYIVEARIRRFDGVYRWNVIRGHPVRDAGGKIVRWYSVLSDIDDRKRAEEGLREQTERLKLGQAAMRMIIMDWNVADDLLTWSDSPEWLRGPMPASGDYPPFNDQVHPEDRARFLATRGLALDTMQVQKTEFRLVRTDGEVIWVLERKQAFAGSDGKAARMLAAMFDITDRKRAEEALRRSEDALRLSEERYALAVDGANQGIFDWDLPNDRVFHSPRAQEFLGLRAGESWRGRLEWAAMIRYHPEDLPRMRAGISRHLNGETPTCDMEYRVVLREGEVRWLRQRGVLRRDAAGKAYRMAGSIEDVTDRKVAAEALRESEARFRCLTDLSSDWYWEQDEALRFTYSSAAIKPPAGHPGGSSIGLARWELPGVVPLSATWEEHKALVAARKPFRDFEYSRPSIKDGTIRYISVTGTPIFDEQGEFRGYYGVGRDITERKRAEEELRKMEERLRLAQRLEAMGTLAGGIAHDFNNILGAVLGYGEMAMRSAKKGSRLRRDLDSIMAAGERGRALVDRVLAFSRSGIADRAPVHVEAVVREVLDQAAARLPSNVTIEPRLSAGRAAMLGDSTQVHQVVMNLASNGVQAMPQGGVLRVALDAARFDAPRPATVGSIAAGDHIVLRVSDSGTGIRADVLERMFDPFFTTKEVGVGSGLGLSLVHGIVTSVGGAIDVDTELGKGSTFTVYLPRNGDAAEKPVDKDRRLPRGRGQRVLVVDDEEPLVRLTAATLEHLGYSPVGFTSSVNALQEFGANPGRFDAILTDERMPGVTGSTIIREVRRIDPSIPILLMSGFVSAATAQKARELGANDVLKKPVLAGELAASLARALLL